MPLTVEATKTFTIELLLLSPKSTQMTLVFHRASSITNPEASLFSTPHSNFEAVAVHTGARACSDPFSVLPRSCVHGHPGLATISKI